MQVAYTVTTYIPRHGHGHVGLCMHLCASQATLGGVKGKSTEIAEGAIEPPAIWFLLNTQTTMYMYMYIN